MQKILAVMLVFGFSAEASVALKDKIYSTHLKQYSQYRKCIQFTTETFNLPEMLILSVLKSEGGTTGKCSTIMVKGKPTTDCGPMQINSQRAAELSEVGMTYEDVRRDGCKNIFGGGYLLAKEIIKSKDFWTGVGNYHYNKNGKAPRFHYKYIRWVHTNWQELLMVKE